jgi:hypothetical protein
MYEEENMGVIIKLLDLLHATFAVLKNAKYALTDLEAQVLIPCLLDKSGRPPGDRTVVMFAGVVKSASILYNPQKYGDLILKCMMGTQNFASKVFCVEQIPDIITSNGATVFGKRGLREVYRLAANALPEGGPPQNPARGPLSLGSPSSDETGTRLRRAAADTFARIQIGALPSRSQNMDTTSEMDADAARAIAQTASEGALQDAVGDFDDMDQELKTELEIRYDA